MKSSFWAFMATVVVIHAIPIMFGIFVCLTFTLFTGWDWYEVGRSTVLWALMITIWCVMCCAGGEIHTMLYKPDEPKKQEEDSQS